MSEIMLKWPQLIADISPLIVSAALSWQLYRIAKQRKGR